MVEHDYCVMKQCHNELPVARRMCVWCHIQKKTEYENSGDVGLGRLPVAATGSTVGH
jgi:hypothetical protein